MDEQLGALIQLQGIDTKIAGYKEEEKRLPQLVEELKKDYNRVQEELLREKGYYEDLLKKRRERERDLDSEEARIHKLKERISEIKTNKEYQAHLKEIETAEAKKREVEEEILLLMEEVERAKEKVTKVQSRLPEEEKRFHLGKERLEGEFEKLSSELLQWEEKRKELVKGIKRELLGTYKQLFAARKGLAVVPSKHGLCLGCHMNIPPQVFAEVRKNDKIIYCAQCQRFLYWKEG